MTTSPRALDAQTHFHRIARQFDDLYETERRNAFRRWIDSALRASIYRRFELTFEHLGDLKGQRVLDVGCGGGRYSLMAHQVGASYVLGLDFAENMIQLATQLARDAGAGADQVDFRCDDFMTSHFDQPFDHAIVMGVFDYVADPMPFLRKLFETVTGSIVASFPVKYDLWAPQRKLRYQLFKNCPLYLYSRSDIEGLMSQLSFRSFQIERAHRDYFVAVEK